MKHLVIGAGNLGIDIYQSLVKHGHQATLCSRSNYAHLKWQMERKVLCAYDKATAIRVGSLYGKHKPLSSFPGRLIQNKLANKPINLPMNLVTPTSTEWLSNLLVENFDAFYKVERIIIHASPSYFTSVINWGSLILDEAIKCEPFFDYERPLISCLGTSFIPQQTDWRDIWQKEWKPLKEKIYQLL